MRETYHKWVDIYCSLQILFSHVFKFVESEKRSWEKKKRFAKKLRCSVAKTGFGRLHKIITLGSTQFSHLISPSKHTHKVFCSVFTASFTNIVGTVLFYPFFSFSFLFHELPFYVRNIKLIECCHIHCQHTSLYCEVFITEVSLATLPWM